MKRSIAAAAAAIAVAGALTPPAGSATRRTCSQLSGPNTVDSTTLEVVREGRLVSGCVLPDGPVRVIGRESVGQVERRLTYVQAGGTFALFEEYRSFNVDGGDSDTTRFVIDLATGRRRTVPADCTTARTLVGSDGRVLVLSTGCSGDRTLLRGVGPRGGTVVLDVGRGDNPIPPDSLALDGRAVRWTHGGADRAGRI